MPTPALPPGRVTAVTVVTRRAARRVGRPEALVTISGVRSTTPEGSGGLSVRLTLLPVRRGPSAMAPDTSVWCFGFRPDADAAGAPMAPTAPSLDTCCRKLSLGGIASGSTSFLEASGSEAATDSGGSLVEPTPLPSGMSVAEVRRSHRSWLLWMPEWARCTLIGVTVSGQRSAVRVRVRTRGRVVVRGCGWVKVRVGVGVRVGGGVPCRPLRRRARHRTGALGCARGASCAPRRRPPCTARRR